MIITHLDGLARGLGGGAACAPFRRARVSPQIGMASFLALRARADGERGGSDGRRRARACSSTWMTRCSSSWWGFAPTTARSSSASSATLPLAVFEAGMSDYEEELNGRCRALASCCARPRRAAWCEVLLLGHAWRPRRHGNRPLRAASGMRHRLSRATARQRRALHGCLRGAWRAVGCSRGSFAAIRKGVESEQAVSSHTRRSLTRPLALVHCLSLARKARPRSR